MPENTASKKKINLTKVVRVVLIYALGVASGWIVMVYGGQLGISLPFTPPQEHIQAAGASNRLFYQAWQLLEKHYLQSEKLDAAEMMQGATQGMVAALGDPYTVYIPPDTQKTMNENLTGAFYGIGVQLGYKDKTLAVMSPVAGGPAERQGVQAADLIIHVKDEAKGVDEDTYDWSLHKIMQVLRGEKGTQVTVTFFREDYNNNQPFTLTFTREEIKMDSLVFEIRQEEDKKIAYLGLGRFGVRTYEEWNEAVEQIIAQKRDLSGVILDLRDNPGGLVPEAIHVASEFISEGAILLEQGKSGKRTYAATGKGRLIGMPLVVLVNQGSASSAEIVAGALRDRLGVKIVGTTTFGKGTVQQRFEMENGAGLNITVNKWLTPSGQWLDGSGLKPDVEVVDNFDPETGRDDVYLQGVNLL